MLKYSTRAYRFYARIAIVDRRTDEWPPPRCKRVQRAYVSRRSWFQTIVARSRLSRARPFSNSIVRSGRGERPPFRCVDISFGRCDKMLTRWSPQKKFSSMNPKTKYQTEIDKPNANVALSTNEMWQYGFRGLNNACATRCGKNVRENLQVIEWSCVAIQRLFRNIHRPANAIYI